MFNEEDSGNPEFVNWEDEIPEEEGIESELEDEIPEEELLRRQHGVNWEEEERECALEIPEEGGMWGAQPDSSSKQVGFKLVIFQINIAVCPAGSAMR